MARASPSSSERRQHPHWTGRPHVTGPPTPILTPTGRCGLSSEPDVRIFGAWEEAHTASGPIQESGFPSSSLEGSDAERNDCGGPATRGL